MDHESIAGPGPAGAHPAATPSSLAELLAPEVRRAAELSRADILAPLSPLQRVLVKAAWPLAMRVGVPAAVRVVIEFLVARYRRDLEPAVGVFAEAIRQAIGEEGATGRLALLGEILDVLRTPDSRFHPAVRAALAEAGGPHPPGPMS
jgi:hypothetical protein